MSKLGKTKWNPQMIGERKLSEETVGDQIRSTMKQNQAILHGNRDVL
jgi:hypothetical protein